LQLALRLRDPVIRIDHVDGQTYRATLVCQCPADRVTDPPARVGREAEPSPIVVPLDGLHEADVPLLDQVRQGQSAVIEPACDRHDQAQIRLHELVLGRLQTDGACVYARYVIRKRLRGGREGNCSLERQSLRRATDTLDLSQGGIDEQTVDVQHTELRRQLRTRLLETRP